MLHKTSVKRLFSPATAQHMAYTLIYHNLHHSFASLGDRLLSRAGFQKRVKFHPSPGLDPLAVWAALHVINSVSTLPSFAKLNSVHASLQT